MKEKECREERALTGTRKQVEYKLRVGEETEGASSTRTTKSQNRGKKAENRG